MKVITEVVEKGAAERRVDFSVGDETVPGIIWTPEGASTARPTVLIGHGGTQHKRVPNVLALARQLVRHLGYAVVAIDAPGHGDRVIDPAVAELARRNLQSRLGGDASTPLAQPQFNEDQMKAMAQRSERGVQEWKSVLDKITTLEEVGDGPFGYWGVSMGTAIGLPFVSLEPRVKAAVLGLAGIGERPGQDRFVQAAKELTVPILFVFQSDDELMSRQSGLDLFDAIGSEEKTMHLNPGGHVELPIFERQSYELFFSRHLGSASK